ncbi:AbgT family transporter [Halomonas dongshanensis]|uniref:AbgT family transporter n=1 Tax=Halomonas dongshanensis TaxID=2890835 RepID=A0ABT2E9W2_9GAMM|nr:AbgT family transporter [Halomonas dongshanensis]MCS2608363.1 AbgT family transporter [Halomonas dongshanensis]
MKNQANAHAGQTTGVMHHVARLADALPHPFIMFFALFVATLGLSAVMSLWLDPVIDPATQELIQVRSLLSWDGLRFMVTGAVTNFTSFRPLGLVLVMVLALGLIQKTGLADAAIKRMLSNVAPRYITPAVIFTSIIGNLVSDAAVFLIPPLAAIMFKTVGRNPVAGIIVAFVSIFAGFSANFFIAGTDLLLSGISTEVVQSVRPGYEVSVVANWFFMCASVPLITLIITVMNDRYTEPMLERFRPQQDVTDASQSTSLSAAERRALRYTGLSALAYIAAVLLLIMPEGSGLRNAEGGLLPSPFMSGLVPFIMIFFILCGIVYGVTVGKISRPSDVPRLMEEAVRDMCGFIVIVFMVAQFIAIFNWSNLAIVTAVNGADWLLGINMPPMVALLGFILLAAVVNLFFYSGSAQWALMAPIFMPMLMLLGLAPEAIQAAYRIADSATNPISPINPYLPLILAVIHLYNRSFTLGHLLTVAMPYSLAILSGWTLLYFVWYALGLPFGL